MARNQLIRGAAAVGLHATMFRMALVFACIFAAGPALAASPTAAELAPLPEAAQRAAITKVVNTSLANLLAKSELDGKPKSAADYERQRIIANLETAIFTQDPQHPQDDPPGIKSVLRRIQKASQEDPQQSLIGVMGDIMDVSYKRFYDTALNDEGKKKFAAMSNADQALQFRLRIQMALNEQAYDRMIKKLEQREAELKQHLQNLDDNTVLLPDGRHVFQDQNGDLRAMADGDNEGVVLRGAEKQLAERLAACKDRRGIKNGREALAACRMEVGIR